MYDIYFVNMSCLGGPVVASALTNLEISSSIPTYTKLFVLDGKIASEILRLYIYIQIVCDLN